MRAVKGELLVIEGSYGMQLLYPLHSHADTHSTHVAKWYLYTTAHFVIAMLENQGYVPHTHYVMAIEHNCDELSRDFVGFFNEFI